MEINPNTVEQMAREYTRALSGSRENDADLLEQAVLLSEEQIDILNNLSNRLPNQKANRTANYLKNLTFRSIAVMYRMGDRGNYIPSVRSMQSTCGGAAGVNRLQNLQLDIFILLDKLSVDYDNRAELSMLENRKASLLAWL